MGEDSIVERRWRDLQKQKVYVNAGRFLFWWWAVASRGGREKMGVTVLDAPAAAIRARRRLYRAEARDFARERRNEELSDD